MRGLTRRTAGLVVIALVSSGVAVAAAGAAEAAPGVHIYLGYVDTFVGTPAHHPHPWQGADHVTFVGCNRSEQFSPESPCPTTTRRGIFYDAGAIRVRNSTAGHVTVSDVFVTIAGCTFDPWPGLHQAVEEHSSLILTQTGATVQCGTTGRGNFDTSDTVPPGANPCVNDGILPIVHVTVNGISEVFEDTGQTLNNGGVDTGFGGCPPVRAENLPWHQISEGGGHVPAVVCQVHNGKTGATVDNLQAAVTAADSGDTLTVSGYCIGTTTIDKNLTIIGQTVDATLDGDQKGSVLTSPCE